MKRMISLAVLLVACSGADNNGTNNGEHEEVTAEADACEHMAEGPAVALTAAAAADGAEAMTDTHTRYDITLVGEGPSYVAFEVAEEGGWWLFQSEGAELRLLDAAGEPVAAEASEEGSEVCPDDVSGGQVWDLGVGSWTVELTSANNTESIVIIPEGDEHAHEGEE